MKSRQLGSESLALNAFIILLFGGSFNKIQTQKCNTGAQIIDGNEKEFCRADNEEHLMTKNMKLDYVCNEEQSEQDATISRGGNSCRRASSTRIYDFIVNNIKGEPVSLEKYKGYVLLIVNVASKCGLTDINYKQLVELDKKYRDRGLRILAFPCNQFGGQEPDTLQQIEKFAKNKGVEFDMFEKIDVNGENAHLLWRYLKTKLPDFFNGGIKWNFSKIIVNKEGQPVEGLAPRTAPLDIVGRIEELLKE